MNQIIKSSMAIFMVFLLMMAFTGSAIATKENPTEKKSVIIMFKDKPDRDLIKHHGGDIKTIYHIKPAIAASIPQKAIDALNRNPKIDYIVNDLEIFTVGETLPWGVNRIDADIVHGYNNGTGVNIAILDTGIDYNHPDLVTNYKGGYDFSGEYYKAPNDDDPMDYDGHGTHVAGTVAAIDNDIGVIGVAPEANLYAFKIFADDGSGSYSDVIEALEWCIDTRGDDGDSENDIQVISMSFGSSYRSGNPGIESWINDAYDAGILLVGAAGNDGNWRGTGDNVIYPARYDNVIAVAATYSNDNRAYFSSTGPDVELAAPGYSIYSTVLNDDYGYKSGTSMACPHVTGTVALVIASGIIDENANGRINDEIRQRLQETAEYLGNPLHYGFGLVDAEEAVPQNGPANQPPVANAGSDQTAETGITLPFDGSGSTDSDGTIVSYDWDFGDGNTDTGMSTTHAYSTADTYTVTLTVTDDDGATDSDTAIVTVGEPSNQPPVADAGVEQTVNDADNNGMETVTLNGSSSYDPDGTIVSYEWRNDTDVLNTEVSFMHDFSVGVHNVTLTVTDDGGSNSSDEVVVTVNANQVPVANAGDGQTASDIDNNGVEAITLNGSSSYDPDGIIVSYEWRNDTDELSTEVSFTHDFSVGVHNVTLTVTDDGGATSSDDVNITVNEAPTLPTLHIANIDMSLKTAGPNKNAIALVTVFDFSGDPVAGATVEGYWSDLTVDIDSGPTDASGEVKLNSDKVRNAPLGTIFTFTVDSVALDGWTYDPDANDETTNYITVV